MRRSHRRWWGAFVLALGASIGTGVFAQIIPAPTAAEDSAPKTPAPIATPIATIVFAAGSDRLTPEAMAMLDTLALAMAQSRARIEIYGYAGPRAGRDSMARRLSLRRALAIRFYLAGKGIARERTVLRPIGGAADGDLERADIVYVKR